MAEEDLETAYIYSVLEKVNCEAVAHEMGVDVLVESLVETVEECYCLIAVYTFAGTTYTRFINITNFQNMPLKNATATAKDDDRRMCRLDKSSIDG